RRECWDTKGTVELFDEPAWVGLSFVVSTLSSLKAALEELPLFGAFGVSASMACLVSALGAADRSLREPASAAAESEASEPASSRPLTMVLMEDTPEKIRHSSSPRQGAAAPLHPHNCLFIYKKYIVSVRERRNGLEILQRQRRAPHLAHFYLLPDIFQFAGVITGEIGTFLGIYAARRKRERCRGSCDITATRGAY